MKALWLVIIIIIQVSLAFPKANKIENIPLETYALINIPEPFIGKLMESCTREGNSYYIEDSDRRLLIKNKKVENQ